MACATRGNYEFFIYKPAFVIHCHSETKVDITFSHPFLPGLTNTTPITIELSATPSFARWNDVQVDDYDDHDRGGFTTLGPTFPMAHCCGGVYLSKTFYDRATRSTSTTDIPFDHTALLFNPQYQDKPALRYHGFFAEVIKASSEEDSPFSYLTIYHAGYPHTDLPPVKTYLNIDSKDIILFAKDYHPYSDPWGHGKSGTIQQIYLERNYAIQIGLEIPKRPSGTGIPLVGIPDSAADLDERFCQSTHHQFINIIHRTAGSEVEQIREKLTEQSPNENTITIDGESIEEVALEMLVKASGLGPSITGRTLDIIGHSRSSDFVLLIGSLPLYSSNAVALFTLLGRFGFFKLLGIKEIRFLGCRTACGEQPRQAALQVKDALASMGIDVRVSASKVDLFTCHFRRHVGFVRTELLAREEVLRRVYGPVDGASSGAPRETFDNWSPLDTPEVPTFSLENLSRLDSSRVKAHAYSYLYESFDELAATIGVNQGEPVSPWTRATMEVAVPFLPGEPASTSTSGCFDVLPDNFVRIVIEPLGAFAYPIIDPDRFREVLAAASRYPEAQSDIATPSLPAAAREARSISKAALQILSTRKQRTDELQLLAQKTAERSSKH